jgi:hypothetical protein
MILLLLQEKMRRCYRKKCMATKWWHQGRNFMFSFHMLSYFFALQLHFSPERCFFLPIILPVSSTFQICCSVVIGEKSRGSMPWFNLIHSLYMYTKYISRHRIYFLTIRNIVFYKINIYIYIYIAYV